MADGGSGAADAGGGKAGGKGGKRKLLLALALGVPLLLGAAAAGLWAFGYPPFSPGKGGEGSAAGPEGAAEATGRRSAAPVFFEMPEILANLNATGRRTSFIKLKSRLELAKASDAAAVQAAMPRLLDLFQTYLRETRPEELRGSAGTHRLREELMARANLAAAPAKVLDVLFVEMLIQ